MEKEGNENKDTNFATKALGEKADTVDDAAFAPRARRYISKGGDDGNEEAGSADKDWEDEVSESHAALKGRISTCILPFVPYNPDRPGDLHEIRQSTGSSEARVVQEGLHANLGVRGGRSSGGHTREERN